jgi:hypothetical protein
VRIPPARRRSATDVMNGLPRIEYPGDATARRRRTTSFPTGAAGRCRTSAASRRATGGSRR